MFFTVPLTNLPQQFQIVLSAITYLLTVKWNDMDSSWYLDIADQNDDSIVAGIPLVTGIDLLKGLSYLGIGGSLFVYTSAGNSLDVPTLASLGTDSNLYFYTEAANVA